METTGFFHLAPWIVFFPLIGLLTNLVFGGWFMKQPWGEKAIGWTASAAGQKVGEGFNAGSPRKDFPACRRRAI